MEITSQICRTTEGGGFDDEGKLVLGGVAGSDRKQYDAVRYPSPVVIEASRSSLDLGNLMVLFQSTGPETAWEVDEG